MFNADMLKAGPLSLNLEKKSHYDNYRELFHSHITLTALLDLDNLTRSKAHNGILGRV